MRNNQVLQIRGENNMRNQFAGRNIPGGGSKKTDRSVRRELDHCLKGLTANLKEHIKVQNCCSPQACKFIALMDDPFNAPWEDAKMPYYPGGQPLKTTVIRAFGTTGFTVNANTATQIYWAPNPGTNQSAGQEPQQQLIVQGATLGKGIPGCPPFATANAGGVGVSAGPHCGFIRENIAIATNNLFTPNAIDTDQYIQWDTASQLGEDAPDKPGLFSYRLVAAAMRITPTAKELDLGGFVASSRIGESTNVGYAGTTIMMANSSVHYQRGSRTIELKYMRSSDDDQWNFPSVGPTAISANINGLRNFMTILNPDSLVSNDWLLTTVAFYEIKGVAAKTVGNPSYQQPQSAGKIASALGHITSEETGSEKGGSKKEINNAVELINAKESPVTGKLASGVKDHEGFFDKIEDFVGTVGPVAEKVIGTVLPLLL